MTYCLYELAINYCTHYFSRKHCRLLATNSLHTTDCHEYLLLVVRLYLILAACYFLLTANNYHLLHSTHNSHYTSNSTS